MVRDKNIIYAEKNDEDTVLSEQNIVIDELVVGNSDKNLKSYKNNGIVVIDNNGIISTSITTEPNKIMCLDINKNIVWRSIR